MNSKKINNLVFFRFNGERERMYQACVFYKDGSVKMLSYDDGIKLVKELADENNVITKGDFKELFGNLVNKKLIHVVTGEYLEKNFKSFQAVKSAEKVEKATKTVAPVVVEARKKPEVIEEKMFSKVRPKKKEKSKKKPFVLRVAAGALAAVVGLTGLSYALNKTDKSGKMLKHNVKTASAEVESDNELVKENNDYYDSYTYEQLLEVTNNQTQKAEMKRIHDALVGYNVEFANNYIEEGKDIKAALSFDEVVALSQAYNDFTPEEIKAIFNGKAFKAAELDSAYKTATLQLMGAHVIESREHPVDMSGIIISEEGKAFYNKYHNLFLNAKEATGDEKIAAVEAFYNELRADFPIDVDNRETGIAHSESHQVIESYKMAVTPMVAAGEIMWQNLDIDKTLQGGVNDYFLGSLDVNDLSREELIELLVNSNDGVSKGEIDYFNDLGLCNIAEEKFEIVQQITMGAFGNEDNTNPTYDQYKNAIIKELTDQDAYVIDDAHRELSELDRFQEEVNWHFNIDGEGQYTGSVYYTTETHTRTRRWKKTKTTKRTEVTRTEKEITDEAKKKIDEEIAEENKENKEEGERQAEETRQEIQEEEDKKADEIKEEVKKDEEDLQDKIDDANKKIDENQKIQEENEGKPAEEQKPIDPVNEDDFGNHNVDFDDQHSDSEGNLNDSVEDITTDGTGAKTPADLPDPNETGKKFDEEGEKQAPKASSSSSSSNSESSSKSESAPKTEAPAKTESAPAPKAEAPAKAESAPAPKAEPAPAPAAAPAKKSNEQIVNDYVENLANDSDADYDEAKELHK